MTLWMLDTNVVGHLLRGDQAVRTQLEKVSVGSVCLSVVTLGEIHYGLARRSNPALQNMVRQLLMRMRIEPWTEGVAETYGQLRASMEAKGRPLGALDMQIAAHASYLQAWLVTNDKAFRQVPDLQVVDWRA